MLNEPIGSRLLTEIVLQIPKFIQPNSFYRPRNAQRKVQGLNTNLQLVCVSLLKMNFKRALTAALPAVAFSLMPSASLATTSSTLFQATVNNNCNFTATDENAALTLGSNGKVLSGETTTLKIKCNYGVELGLELDADNNNPETTTNASTITLDGASSALTAGSGGKYALGNANGVEKAFKLGMTATSANAQLLPGTYKYTVTMTLIAAASE